MDPFLPPTVFFGRSDAPTVVDFLLHDAVCGNRQSWNLEHLGAILAELVPRTLPEPPDDDALVRDLSLILQNVAFRANLLRPPDPRHRTPGPPRLLLTTRTRSEAFNVRPSPVSRRMTACQWVIVSPRWTRAWLLPGGIGARGCMR